MNPLAAARRPAPPAGTASPARDDAVTLAGSLILVVDGVPRHRPAHQPTAPERPAALAARPSKKRRNPCSSPS